MKQVSLLGSIVGPLKIFFTWFFILWSDSIVSDVVAATIAFLVIYTTSS